jgi:hypothetical protein
MRSVGLFAVGALCGALLIAWPKVAAHVRAVVHGAYGGKSGTNAGRVHTEEKFAFTANGPMEQVAPLFGADKERVWAPHWDPQFVHPEPASDEQGMVFTVAHQHMRSAWVNTAFDPKNGRIQYVYMIPDALVTVITLNLTPQGQQTKVEVAYDRTALSPDADAHVRHMAEGDRGSGPEWEQQVNGYLAARK